MRFEQPASRNVMMTHEQCLAIVVKSAELECPSISFVKAVKFETALRQIDVIGEWAPSANGGELHWSASWPRTYRRSARDLKSYRSCGRIEGLPPSGYRPCRYRRGLWKRYRDNRYTERLKKGSGCGWRAIKSVVGGFAGRWAAEAVEATGLFEMAGNLATHSTTTTTRRYNRGDGLVESRLEAEARAEKPQ